MKNSILLIWFILIFVLIVVGAILKIEGSRELSRVFLLSGLAGLLFSLVYLVIKNSKSSVKSSK